MNDRMELRKRLLKNVEIDPVTLCMYGVGQMEYGGRQVKASRLSAYAFELFDLEKGKVVCHHCDNSWCINPTHLFIGTDKDNAQDCLLKNRKGGIRFDGEWPYIPVLFPQSLFFLAAGLTREHGLKMIPDLVREALRKIPRKK